jgi:hypothetical protein
MGQSTAGVSVVLEGCVGAIMLPASVGGLNHGAFHCRIDVDCGGGYHQVTPQK